MGRSGWLQLGGVAALGVLAVVALSDRSSSSAGPSAATSPAAPTGTVVLADAPETSVVLLTTTTDALPSEWVDDCVDLVQFGAFVGDPELGTMWEAAGHDVGRLRANCTSLGRADPQRLAALSRRRAEVDAYLGVGDGSSVPTVSAVGGRR
jgi:hypothetical protein